MSNLVADGKISEPGIYTMAEADYHGDCCVGPSISGSGLIKIEQTCPAKFWWDSYHNPERELDADESKALALGKAAHKLGLEGRDAFDAIYRVMGDDIDLRTKIGKAWVAEQQAAGFRVLRPDDAQMIERMARALASNPLAAGAFVDGAPERSLIWQDKATGIWLKSRPDWLPNVSRFVPNYKTALSVHPLAFKAQAIKLGYNQSAALCMDACRAVAGIDNPVPYFVGQEKKPPYLVGVFTMDEETLEWGRLLNRRALDRFARCIESGQWPGYDSEATTITMPAWAAKTLQDRHDKGEFTFTEGEQE